jgi:excisionase family DNA binding protein
MSGAENARLAPTGMEVPMTSLSQDYSTISLTKGQVALVSSEDFEPLSRYRWYALWSKKLSSFYAVRYEYRDGKRWIISMHRQVLGLGSEDRRQGHHMFRNTLDNRREMLVALTASEHALLHVQLRKGTIFQGTVILELIRDRVKERQALEALKNNLQLNFGVWRGNRLAAERGQMAVPEVMDVRQAAAYLGLSTDTLYNYAASGKIPSFKFGNRWRFKKSVLDKWMEEQSKQKEGSNGEIE